MGLFSDFFEPDSRKAEQVSTGYQKSTSTTSLPDWQLPYVQAQLGKVAAMPGFQAYAGPTSAPRSGVATLAERLAALTATGGSPALTAASGYTGDVLAGKYLNANPYLDAMFSNASDRLGEQFRKQTAPAIAAQFSLGGRYGSGAQREALAQAAQQVGDQQRRLATDIYGGAYNAERANMEAAAGRAPALNAAGYTGAQVLGNLGSAADAYADNDIARQLQLYQFGQTAPFAQEAARTGMLAGNYGRTTQSEGTSNSTTSKDVYGPSPFESILGVGSSLAGMALPFLKGFKIF